MRIYSHGSVEDLFEWRRDVDDVLVRKPCNTAISRFEMVEVLLSGDPLVTWREIRRAETMTIPVGGVAQGDSDDAFDSVMRRFFLALLPEAHKRGT